VEAMWRSASHPAFNAALYILDVLIPALAFGQAVDWDPQGMALRRSDRQREAYLVPDRLIRIATIVVVRAVGIVDDP
jgi:hypothetical protein